MRGNNGLKSKLANKKQHKKPQFVPARSIAMAMDFLWADKQMGNKTRVISMMMIKLLQRLSFFIAVGFAVISCSGLSGCAYYKQQQENHRINEQNQNSYVTQFYNLPAFNTLKISGNAVVELSSGKPCVYYSGRKKDIDKLRVEGAPNMVLISSFAEEPIIIKLQTNSIKNIYAEDYAAVIGDNINANDLRILAEKNASIKLTGKFDVKSITQRGKGKIEIRWIDSDALLVNSEGNGPIYLAGAVKNLEARLADSAHFDGRYLRAQKASIFTTDSARADVLASKTLNAYAERYSHIFYYKRPQHFTKVAKDSGNILLLEALK